MTIAKTFPYKRIFAFFLVLCLVCMVVIPPQPAHAVLGVGALVAGEALSAEIIGSVIAALVMAAAGVGFDNAYYGDTDNLSVFAYEIGYEMVRDIIISGGNVNSWLDEIVGIFALAGGIKPGDSFEVPAEVLEYARAWVNDNYDLGDIVSITNQGIVTDTGEVVLVSDSASVVGTAFYSSTDYTTSDFAKDAAVPINIGPISLKVGRYVDRSTSGVAKGSLYINAKVQCNFYQGTIRDSYYGFSTGTRGSDADATSLDSEFLEKFNTEYASYYGYLWIDSENSCLRFAYTASDGTVNSVNNCYLNLDALGDSYVIAESSMYGSDALNNPYSDGVVVNVPQAPTGEIGGYTVPGYDVLTPDMVIGDVITDNPTDNPTDDPDTNIGEDDPPFVVPDTWAGIDAWLKAQGVKLTGIFNDVKGFVADFPKVLSESLPAALTDVWQGVLDAVAEPFKKMPDRFTELKNKLLPFIQNGFGFPSIWHYVVSWVGSLAPWLATMFTIWNGLPASMVIPVYATAVIVIVIGMYRRFFM